MARRPYRVVRDNRATVRRVSTRSRSSENGPAGRPRVVALGGGHGLATTLSAVARYAGRVTAVVSVADDGGSSGRLRASWDGPAPGDVRRCLLALAGHGPQERLWAQALDYRFSGGELSGHSLGNLVLLALSETTGDFGTATAEVARLLGVSAKVLAATSVGVRLRAEVDSGTGPVEVEGQVEVAHSEAPIRRVWLNPPCPPVPDEALEAIATADQIVLGPGSLFTSVLAVCAVPGIRRALAARRGGRVYVCNLGPQHPETSGFDADAHIAALVAHGVVFDTVVCDPATESGTLTDPRRSRAVPSSPDGVQASPEGVQVGLEGVQVVNAAVAKPNGHTHDPGALAQVLEALALRGG